MWGRQTRNYGAAVEKPRFHQQLLHAGFLEGFYFTSASDFH